MADGLEGLAACGSQALRRTTLATLYNGVQRKKIQKIIQRQATHAASRSDDPHRGPRRAGVQTGAVVLGRGHVWAGIYGFDSVFDGPGRFALDRADLRQKCDDLSPFSASKQMRDNCPFHALTPSTWRQSAAQRRRPAALKRPALIDCA